MPIHFGKINGIDLKEKTKEIQVLLPGGQDYFIFFNEIQVLNDYVLVLLDGKVVTKLNKKKFEIENLVNYPNSVTEVDSTKLVSQFGW